MPDKDPQRSLHIPQSSEVNDWFYSNGLYFVILTFSGLATINILTLVVGPQRVYSVLNSHVYTAFLSFVIYDSPGTVAGLFGIVVIFAVLSLFYFLLTGEACKIRAYSFIVISMVTGVASQIFWNSCCSQGGGFPAGSSAIDFAALACLINYSVTDSVRLLRLNANRKSRLWMDSRITAVYLILVAGMLMLYAVYIQPIYLPTIRFNWRVHEYAFVSALVVSFLVEMLRLTRTATH